MTQMMEVVLKRRGNTDRRSKNAEDKRDTSREQTVKQTDRHRTSYIVRHLLLDLGSEMTDWSNHIRRLRMNDLHDARKCKHYNSNQEDDTRLSRDK